MSSRLRGRRWRLEPLVDGRWRWRAWRLFERMEGTTGTEEEARAAVDHFLSSPSTYTLEPREQ